MFSKPLLGGAWGGWANIPKRALHLRFGVINRWGKECKLCGKLLMIKLFLFPDLTHLYLKSTEVVLCSKSTYMKKLFFIPLLAFLISCQPSKITQSWAAKDAAPTKYKKILVLGVLTDNDIELQTKIENHLADDLKDMGYLAIAANKVFPAGTFVKGDTARAAAAISGKGFDAILTIVLLDKVKEPYFVPGRMNDYSYLRNGGFNRYYNTVAEQIYTPGYYGEETKYVWENNFYDISSRRLIYSARSRSFDIASKSTLAHTYGLLMAQSLVEKNILIKPDTLEE